MDNNWKEMHRKRFQELKEEIDILYSSIVALGGVDKVFAQYYEGAITLAEFNLRLLEFMHQVNNLGRLFEESSHLEDIING